MPFDPEPYAEGIRRLNQRELKRTRDHAHAARRDAHYLARRIGEDDPNVSRVYLFGSLLEDTPRRPNFDIDLAIEGGDVHRAMERAEGIDRHVDIVCLHLLPRHVQRRIRETGVVLFERVQA